jgi:hypothetical protein
MFPHCPRLVAGLSLFVLISGCRPDSKVTTTDTAAVSVTPVDPVIPSARNPGWEDSVSGPVLLLAHPDNARLAAIVFPSLTDSALAQGSAPAADTLAGMSFDLLDRSGGAGTARLLSRVTSVPAEGCISWPVATFEDTVAKAWRVGLQRGVATPLLLDSLESVTPADSLSITTELARLASALPASNDPAFQGLPFSVRKAYRSKIGPTSLVIGDIVRKINEEANPREERLLLIGERGSGDAYSTVFHSRAAGSEEIVRTNEILAAVKFKKGNRPAIIVAFEYENGSRIALIERLSSIAWRLTWRSAYAGC